MSRTRIRQAEQVISTKDYDDTKTMANAEATPGQQTVEDDLNYIRTQLRLLGEGSKWYDAPANQALDMSSSSTGSPVAAQEPIDVGANYDAGEPHELSVYLNGELLAPSTVSSSVITVERDYQEVDENGDLVESGEVGRKIRVNFPLISGDILRFIWS